MEMVRHNLHLLVLYPMLLGVAQILVKTGVDRSLAGRPVGGIRDLLAMVLSPWIIAGVGLTGLSMFLWFFIISRVELGRAYPFTSLSYFFVQAVAVALFHEQPTVWRWVGLIFIALGVALASNN